MHYGVHGGYLGLEDDQGRHHDAVLNERTTMFKVVDLKPKNSDKYLRFPYNSVV